MNRAILIIDDDIDFQFIVGTMLNRSGYVVKSLLTGKVDEALEMAKDCDMVLLDMELPGVNGIEIGKELKSFSGTIDIPIILLSGNEDAQNMLGESHANTFLQKPFSLLGLMSKIKELLVRK